MEGGLGRSPPQRREIWWFAVLVYKGSSIKIPKYGRITSIGSEN